MQLQGRIGRSILLFTLVLLAVPMVVFPEQFGTKLARASLINAFYELVYYGLVIWVFHRRVTLIQLLQASGACLVYRFAVGAALGFLIAVLYSLDLRVAVTMGMSGYLPAILLHAAATPFILKPALTQLCKVSPVPRSVAQESSTTLPSGQGRTSISVSKEKGVVSRQSPVASPTGSAVQSDVAFTEGKPVTMKAPGDTNGFERAVRYIGEHSSVHLACVIDREGLLLASFKRGEIVPEDWAPLAELFVLGNKAVLDRHGLGSPQKIEVTLREKRVVIAWDELFSLMVISERQSDDFLNIRINQAMELISKYFAERYSPKAATKLERVYV